METEFSLNSKEKKDILGELSKQHQMQSWFLFLWAFSQTEQSDAFDCLELLTTI